MFLGAGSVLHGAGSKDLERLGGLLRRMPRTGTSMILGSVAIAGLPPLNGFASEWLVYLGLLGGGLELGSGPGLLLFLVTAALATIGVLATFCFVRLVGVCLLGQPRSEPAAHAHESPFGIVAPLALLALACVAMALFARHFVPMLGRVAGEVIGAPLDVAPAASRPRRHRDHQSRHLDRDRRAERSFFAILLRGRRAADDTWGCGYVAPTARMQYTGRSFTEIMAEHLLPPMFRARVALKAPRGIFAEPTRISSDSTRSGDPIRLRALPRDVGEALRATAVGTARIVARLHRVHPGGRHLGARLDVAATLVGGPMNEWLVVGGIAVAAVSGIPGLFIGRQRSAGERIALALLALATLAGGAGAARALVAPSHGSGLAFQWPVPGGRSRIHVDALSAMFLLQIFVVSFLGALYGLAYWKQSEHVDNGRKLRLFYGVLTAAMALLVSARNALLFLAGWEVMALAAFLLITTVDQDKEVREVGYIYLVATRIGTLCLFAMFAALFSLRGDWNLEGPLDAHRALAVAVFVLALHRLRSQGGHHADARLAAGRARERAEPRVGASCRAC